MDKTQSKKIETIRLGVIGLGAMGSAHATHVVSGCVEGMVLSAVCDIDESRIAWGREHFPNVSVYQSATELLSSGEVDAVLISTPHPSHPELAIEAFRHGIHVLSEKPAGIDVSSVEQEIEEAQRSGVVFGIMYNQRTNPLFQSLREHVQKGTLGELIRFQWVITNWYRTQAYYDSGSWRATWSGEGGGVLMNQCPHNLDIWQWITGMPRTVRAHCKIASSHDIEVEDAVDIYAEYENGATAHFVAATGEYPGTNRMELVGTRGKAVIENGEMTLSLIDEDIRDVTQDSKECMPNIPIKIVREMQTAPENGHVAIMNDFGRAIRTGSKLLAPGEEGIRGLSIANAAYLSHWTGDSIQLPLDGERYLKELRKRQALGDNTAHKAVVQQNITGEYSNRWSVRW